MPYCPDVILNANSAPSLPRTGAPQGQVLFVGKTGFSGGRPMVGIRLDDRPSSGGSDGKEQGERHFRCEPGMGCFVLQVLALCWEKRRGGVI